MRIEEAAIGPDQYTDKQLRAQKRRARKVFIKARSHLFMLDFHDQDVVPLQLPKNKSIGIRREGLERIAKSATEEIVVFRAEQARRREAS